MMRLRFAALASLMLLAAPSLVLAQAAAPASAKLAQEMVDSVFSFGELGFQEVETSKYLTGVLEKNGFTIERGVSGIPTAWVATWGSGKPVIALGSDIDGIPQASQKPGVAYHDPIIEGAPGHGEGHNTGMPLNIVAALAVKEIMEREKLPGHADALARRGRGAGGDQGVVRARRAVQGRGRLLFTHVGNNLGVSWGDGGGNGLVSVEYTFEGETRTAPARPGAAARRSTPSS
jgi:aminobenzoyl-glutamate utilization protein B